MSSNIMISQCESCKDRAITKSDLKIIFLCPDCPDFENVEFEETDKLDENDIEQVMNCTLCSRGAAMRALRDLHEYNSVDDAIRKVHYQNNYD